MSSSRCARGQQLVEETTLTVYRSPGWAFARRPLMPETPAKGDEQACAQILSPAAPPACSRGSAAGGGRPLGQRGRALPLGARISRLEVRT